MDDSSSKSVGMNFGLLWLRMLCGLGMAYHGYGIIFPMDHMGGFAQGVANLGLPYPAVLAWVAALSELAGGLFLAIGFFTRYAAFFIFATMSVAVFMAHAADPFAKKELALAYWAMSGALMFMGAGSFSLDRK